MKKTRVFTRKGLITPNQKGLRSEKGLVRAVRIVLPICLYLYILSGLECGVLGFWGFGVSEKEGATGFGGRSKEGRESTI